MHAEVVDNKAGSCPICKMSLVPIRLDLVWSCQLHPDVSAKESGTCRICGRDLVRMTKALSYTCTVHPRVDQLDPGACPLCKRRLVAKYSIRPHGDHNPKYGGQLFMAPNNWHIEVAHPAVAVFRLYVYDEYSRPFVPPGFSGRIVAAPDAAGKSSDVSIPFKRSGANPVLEARTPRLGLPATIAIAIRFQASDLEYRFDFVFADYSKEPVRRGRAAR